MTTIKITEAVKCTVKTMGDGCFNWINDYLNTFENLKAGSIEETKNNIMNTPNFKSGCMTYIQAQAFAEYYYNTKGSK